MPPIAASPLDAPILITAGSSWAALHLGRALLDRGCPKVLLFDQRPPLCPLEPGLVWCQVRACACNAHLPHPSSLAFPSDETKCCRSLRLFLA
jgi:hypothetical protein